MLLDPGQVSVTRTCSKCRFLCLSCWGGTGAVGAQVPSPSRLSAAEPASRSGLGSVRGSRPSHQKSFVLGLPPTRVSRMSVRQPFWNPGEGTGHWPGSTTPAFPRRDVSLSWRVWDGRLGLAPLAETFPLSPLGCNQLGLGFKQCLYPHTYQCGCCVQAPFKHWRSDARFRGGLCFGRHCVFKSLLTLVNLTGSPGPSWLCFAYWQL